MRREGNLCAGLLYSCIFILFSAHVFAQKTEKLLVYFAFNSSYFDSASRVMLNEYATRFGKGEGLSEVKIFGHCDSAGRYGYNDSLSVKRANRVHLFLLGKGFNPELFTAVDGYGKRKPLNMNSSQGEMQLNRRAEVYFYLKEKKDTFSQSKMIKTDNINITNINIDSVKVGEKIRLRNIQFFPGRHLMRPESYPEAKNLLALLRDYPTMEIKIEGHVCCTENGEDGIDWDNNQNNLSVTRAKAIYDFLLLNGIDKNRISFEGMAGKYHLAPEINEENKNLNRRVEVKILKK